MANNDNGDLHKDIGDLKFVVGEINGKLDVFIELVKSGNDNHQKIEGRVRSVENKQYWFGGMAAMLGAFGSYLLNSFKI